MTTTPNTIPEGSTAWYVAAELESYHQARAAGASADECVEAFGVEAARSGGRGSFTDYAYFIAACGWSHEETINYLKRRTPLTGRQ